MLAFTVLHLHIFPSPLRHSIFLPPCRPLCYPLGLPLHLPLSSPSWETLFAVCIYSILWCLPRTALLHFHISPRAFVPPLFFPICNLNYLYMYRLGGNNRDKTMLEVVQLLIRQKGENCERERNWYYSCLDVIIIVPYFSDKNMTHLHQLRL